MVGGKPASRSDVLLAVEIISPRISATSVLSRAPAVAQSSPRPTPFDLRIVIAAEIATRGRSRDARNLTAD